MNRANRQNWDEHLREKRTAVLKCYCTPGDKRMFEQHFGVGELSRKIRELMIEACRKKSRIHP